MHYVIVVFESRDWSKWHCARPMEHNAIAGSAGLFIVEYSQWNGTNLLLGFKNKLSCGPGQIIHIKLARCSRMSVLW